MENMILICAAIGIILLIIVISGNKKEQLTKKIEEIEYDKKSLELEVVKWRTHFETLKNATVDPTKVVDSETHRKALQEKENVIEYLKNEYGILEKAFIEVKEKLDLQLSNKKSQEVRLGQISEKLIPFLQDFKYDPKNLAALFQPIDYIAFNEDEIVFIEVKTGAAQMSAKQKQIKKNVDEKRIRFEIHQINEEGYKIK